MNIKAMKQVLGALNVVVGLIKYQYTGSREAMSALQAACDNAWDAIEPLQQAIDKAEKQKTLTDKEIKECMNKAWREVVEHCVETKTDVDICDLDLWFARAIEAAHGIKGKE